MHCGNIQSKWLGAAIGKHTTIQIECPHIIENTLVGPTTEDEELRTDHGRGMIRTTIRSRTINHDTGPLSRYWSTRSSDQLDSALISKDMTCRDQEHRVNYPEADLAHSGL